MKLCLLLIVMVLAVSGCVVQRTLSFNDADFAPYAREGTATVTGQAFMKTQGGDVKYGAGNKIILVPVTPHTNEDYELSYVEGKNITPPTDPRIAKYSRGTIADGNGDFEFKNLPAGDYLLGCVITWKVDEYTTTGGQIGMRVHVDDGQSQKVILTR